MRVSLLFALSVVTAMSSVASAQGLLYSYGEGLMQTYFSDGIGRVVGDANGDGISDFAVPHDLMPGAVTQVIEVFSGADAASLLVIEPVDFKANHHVDRALAVAGDVDNDGDLDLISGRGMNEYGGEVLVFSLSDGALIRQYATAEEDFGQSVGGAGDLDQDGFDDYVVTASGRAVAISGADGVELHQVDGLFYHVNSVAGLGDVDGDGFDDWAAGNDGVLVAGRVRVLSGQTGDVTVDLSGQHELQQFGSSIAAVPDFDGDDRPDLLVGSPISSVAKVSTEVHVLSGQSGETIRTWKGTSSQDGFGRSVAAVGDVDGDGWPEVLVGAPFDDVGGYLSGRVFLFSGQSGETLFTLLGATPKAGLGQHVSSLGDVDGDGVPDLFLHRNKSDKDSPLLLVHSGAKQDLLIGTGLTGSIEQIYIVHPDVDERFFPGVAGQKLKLTMEVLSGNLVPRIAIVDASGETLKQISFKAPGPQTKSYKLKQSGMLRLRVRGLKTDKKKHSEGEYRVETDCKFLGQAGPQSVVRKGKSGKTLVVEIDALAVASLDGIIVPKKYEGEFPVPSLEAPDGELVDLAPYVSQSVDGTVTLTAVPLRSLGRYRLLVPAAATGKSKVAFELVPTQPKGSGSIEMD